MTAAIRERARSNLVNDCNQAIADRRALLDLVAKLEQRVRARDIAIQTLSSIHANRAEAVRALHGYYTDQSGKKWCDHCSVHVGYEQFESRPWPCPTIRALEGK